MHQASGEHRIESRCETAHSHLTNMLYRFVSSRRSFGGCRIESRCETARSHLTIMLYRFASSRRSGLDTNHRPASIVSIFDATSQLWRPYRRCIRRLPRIGLIQPVFSWGKTYPVLGGKDLHGPTVPRQWRYCLLLLDGTACPASSTRG